MELVRALSEGEHLDDPLEDDDDPISPEADPPHGSRELQGDGLFLLHVIPDHDCTISDPSLTNLQPLNHHITTHPNAVRELFNMSPS